MSAGTEARLPFLDHRIVEAVLKTSARTKLNAGYTKYMLRKTMDKHVPQEICWRRVKNGFETPAQHWFATDLAPQIEELLSREGSPLSSFFDLKAIQKRFHNSGAACLSEFDWFKLMTTDVWLEQLKRAGPTRQASPVAQCGG